MRQNPSSVASIRLDELLVTRGLAESRSQAKGVILAGRVRSGTTVLDKPGKTYPPDLPLEVQQPPRFVSRGGDKLLGLIEALSLPVAGRHVLDVGASTGGFTDCLLQHDAASATCIDVGHGQLHWKLRQDPRVTNLEKVNARYLEPTALPRPLYDIIVMDLSFISLRKVLPSVWPHLAPGGWLGALVKPQFEAEKAEADRGAGIIKDPAVRNRVVNGIQAFCRDELAGSRALGVVPSPITGQDGNQEYLLALTREE